VVYLITHVVTKIPLPILPYGVYLYVRPEDDFCNQVLKLQFQLKDRGVSYYYHSF